MGDAVLDMIVVSVLFEQYPDHSHGQMTLIKAALVNADPLAFLCIDLALMQDTMDNQQKNDGTFYEVHELNPL